MNGGIVTNVALSKSHDFSKQSQGSIMLLADLGVEGDSHAGVTVKHRSRVKADPTQPNLRQVHLIHSELFDELSKKGHQVRPADLGENITTRGIALLDLPRNTILRIGEEAEVRITGLRNPCAQIEAFQSGLLKQVLTKRPDGTLERKSGIMGVVEKGGEVRPEDTIEVILPPEPYERLERV